MTRVSSEAAVLLQEEQIGAAPLKVTHCYLCGSNAELDETGKDHLVTCADVCGRYIITRQARRELGLIPGTAKGFNSGTKNKLVSKLQKLREEDVERTILVHRYLEVKFV